MDENEFFRQATLRLCGNLEIEKAMSDCLGYIQAVIPAWRMELFLYERGLGAMRKIATATDSENDKTDILIPLPGEGREIFEKVISSGRFDVAVINRPEQHPAASVMFRSYGLRDSSVLSMRLETEGGTMGGAVLIARGLDAFTEEHARIYSLIREPFTVALSNALAHMEVFKLQGMLADDNQYLRRELLRITGDEIVGADFGLKEVMRLVRQVASTESPVLLTGETGVGKDVVANAIHLASPRGNGPFITVNCGAIPDTLLDSELFGHEKGAFTGAMAKNLGRFERAQQGTIFLDEIGEMPLGAQVRLLRVLQHHEIERIGGTESIAVDIRILIATNKNLEELVKAGRFREDLWFRLNVFPIVIPPLRERTTDIPALLNHFLERKSRELKLGQFPKLADGVLDTLISYPWPGNVRELENLVERELILHPDEPLTFDQLAPPGRPTGYVTSTSGEEHVQKLETVVKNHILGTLELTNGKIHGAGGAGEMLGLNPNTLRSQMRKLGIPFGGRET